MNLPKPSFRQLLLACWLLCPPIVNASTYYVNPAVTNDSGSGTKERPKKHLASGLALLSAKGGDTLILAAGLYDSPRDAITRSTAIHNGRSGAFNTIKAEADGSAVLAREFDLPLTSAFLQFEGLKWDGAFTKAVAGHHLKFLRCAFRGGPGSGNAASVTVGTNDQSPGATYVLIEDSWIYGPGGRYKLLAYNAEYVVFRRVVVRHDGGWTYDHQNPQGGITIYNSKDVQLQNVMVIDSDLVYQGWEAGIYLPKSDDPKTLPLHSGTRIKGSIVLNVAGNAIGFDGLGRIQDAQVDNTVIWRAGGGIALNNGSHSVTAHNLTIGEISGAAFAVWGGKGSVLDVRHSIVHKVGSSFNRQAGSLTHRYNNCHKVRAIRCSEIGETSYDPMTNGLKYLPQIEAASSLKTAGENMNQVGAQVLKRIGSANSLFGDDEFDSVTGDALWPWPNEERLRNDVCSGDITRGLCAQAASLTNYVWGFLGSMPPAYVR